MKNLINNKSIKTKLTISSLIFSIPVIIMLYFIISGIGDDIRFSKYEQYGNQYQKATMRIFSSFMSFYISKINSDDNQTKNIAVKIDSEFNTLIKTNEEIGEILLFTKAGLEERGNLFIEINNFKELWNIIKEEKQINIEKYDQFVLTLDSIFTHSGNTSNLILDPDLDSYYLMDITLLTIPPSLLKFYEVIKALHKDKETERDFILQNSYYFKTECFGHLKKSLNTSLKEDKNFYGVLPSMQNSLNKIPEELTECSNTLSEALESYTKKQIDNIRLIDIIHISADKLITVWFSSVDCLDALLKVRIDFYKNKRMISLFLSLLSLFIAYIVVFIIAKSIIRPINDILSVINNTKKQDLTRIIEINSKDEVGEIGTSFNTLVNSLKDIISNIKVISEKNNLTGQNLSANSEEISATLCQIDSELEKVNDEIRALNNNISKTNTAKNDVKNVINYLNLLIEKQRRFIDENSVIISKMMVSIDNFLDIIDEKKTIINNIVQLSDRQKEGLSEELKLLTNISVKSEQLKEFVNIINKISSETNLLSMNANIEAAHAGNYGSGFSVVANEIRSLSIETSNNSKKITTVIKDIFESVKENYVINQKTSKDINSALDDVKTVSISLSDILKELGLLKNEVKDISEKFSSLRDITIDITNSSTNVNDRVNVIDRSIESLLDLSEKTSNAVSEITFGINEISKTVFSFAELIAKNSESLNELNEEILIFKT